MSKGGKIIVGAFVAAVAAVSATIHVYPIAVARQTQRKERKGRAGAGISALQHEESRSSKRLI